DDKNTDIFFTHLQTDGSWGNGQSIGKPLNNDGNNSVIVVLPDGNTLLIMNRYNSDGSSDGGGLSIVKRSIDGWEVPDNIELEDYHNHSAYAGYCISPSGKVLISAVERVETTGGRDLYVSFKLGGNKWSKPNSMGLTLNTIGHEDMPFIAADNKTLYFSSEGHAGLGNSDVFVTRRLDDSWKSWSKPENLGSGINSWTSELGFKISALGHYAYLYKTGKVEDGGFGKGDIYRVKLSESAKPDPVVFVKGHVFNSETLEPISADITYEDLLSHDEVGVAYSEPLHGKYKIALPYGKQYGYLAHKEGYYSISQNIDLSTEDELHKTVIEDLYLTPIKKGVGIRLHNIFFDPDKSGLKKNSHTELNRLVKLLNDNPELRIEIGGHTDITGDIAYNERLSEKRAVAVMNYLIDQGIDAERLTATGYGQKNPIRTDNTEEGKALNRRVEFKIL
ncbi:OmpA family protein, partial [Crocinitomix catalasitica]|nr:OmpA family protein [Crocinitomix catalasitica]